MLEGDSGVKMVVKLNWSFGVGPAAGALKGLKNG